MARSGRAGSTVALFEGDWAERYFKERNPDVRLDKLA